MLALSAALAVGSASAPAATADTEALVPDASMAPLDRAAPSVGIVGAYVVTLRPGADPLASARRAAAAASHTYTSALRGFAARLTAAQLDRVRRDPEVVAVEQDQTVRVASTQQLPQAGQWGLDRSDQRQLPLDKTYAYGRTGTGVTAFVIDTGIDFTHPEFQGRASNFFDALRGNGSDCHGHGTHVAGTIGSRTYGVAKGVRLKSVRVLDCSGAGSLAGIIAGVDRVRQFRSGPAVANLSLGGARSRALTDAVTALRDSGVAVAVAAGNEKEDACRHSPADAKRVLTVAASNNRDEHAGFSNFGPCVDLYAPGVGVRSTVLGGSTAVHSGTSMAVPHVSGVLALRLQGGATTAAAAQTWVLSSASTGLVTREPIGTPDRLLHKGSL